VTVTDDGIGFDPTADSSGFGLAGLRDRLTLVGGNLSVASTPGSGSTIVATVPMQASTAVATAVATEERLAMGEPRDRVQLLAASRPRKSAAL
jgi:signal transduction histidine kinase